MPYLLLLALLLANPAQATAPLLVAAPPSATQVAEALRTPQGGYLFGLTIDLALDSERDGVWQERGELKVWTVDILAPQAHSLSLHFARAELPPAAQLRVISADGQTVQGPYTRQQVRDGQLWTALLWGERISLELRAPARSQPRLVLGGLNYGFREPLQPQAKSGNCNIDVACPAAAPFADQVRSAVLLQFNNGRDLVSCSGFLVSNAREDLTPYLLTADHCGIRTSNDQSVQAYWRFQRSSCVQPGSHGHGSPDPTFSISGTELLARGQDSDFSLLVIGSAAAPQLPPPSFDPYWSGWDVGDLPAQNGIGVHHPQGDEKAISLFDSPVRSVLVDIMGRDTEAWEVFWDQGTTEAGSSGSALWNEAGRAVGVLSGGFASCANQGGADFYGRLNLAWTESTACDSQLRFWLDPDGQGQQRLDGTDRSQSLANVRVPVCQPTGPTPAPAGGGGSGALSLLALLLLAAARSRRLS